MRKRRSLVFALLILGQLIYPDPLYSSNLEARKPSNKGQCISIEEGVPLVVMDQLMAKAASNLQIQSLKDLVKASQYTLTSSKQYYSPKLIGTANYAFYSSPATSLIYQQGQYSQSSTNSKYGESTPSLTLNQNIVNLAQQSLISSNYFQVDSSKSQTLSQAQGNALSTSQVFTSIVQNYNTLLSIRKIIDAYTKQAANTQKAYSKGEASKIDVISANSQLQLYQQQYLQTQTQIVSLVANLETLVNERVCPPKTNSYLQFPKLDKINPISEETINQAIAIAPSLRNIKASKNIAQSLAQYYRRTYLPTLSAQAGVSSTYQNGNISGIGNATNQYYYNTAPYIQLSINWTMYDLSLIHI